MRATASLCVVTSDPGAVRERCVAAGVDVVRPPSSPHDEPDALVFSVRDPEGNIWSFGTYAGGSRVRTAPQGRGGPADGTG